MHLRGFAPSQVRPLPVRLHLDEFAYSNRISQLARRSILTILFQKNDAFCR